MKTNILKLAIVAASIFSLTANNVFANANTNKNAEQSSSALVYERFNYPFITVKHNNAKGKTYKILNEEGKEIFKGTIKSNDELLLPTRNLGLGKFTFEVGGKKIQQFEII